MEELRGEEGATVASGKVNDGDIDQQQKAALHLTPSSCINLISGSVSSKTVDSATG
ncbi:hypothetical protein A2U01_0082413, partial [Trifolium medium]|nr:hypothetical protein [Trifolium medium]